MRLGKIIEQLETIDFKGDLDIDIKEIVYDSRKAVKNSLFVAIEGYNVDGHNFIDDALNRGAIAVVVEKEVKIDRNIPIIRVKDSRLALANMSSIFYNEPSKKINLVGVTGTNGKTTTTYLIKGIFEAAQRNTGIIGTMGSIIGEEKLQVNNTTPESLDLQKSFDLMLKKNIDNCIMEVSSHSLELSRVEFCDFNVGIFTNLSVDHLDFHENIDNYLAAKIKLFYKTKDCNILNIDDIYGQKILNKLKSLETPILTYGIENKGDIYAKNILYSAEGVEFLLVMPNGQIKVKANIPGLFTVYNCLAAAACGFSYGISLGNIKRGLESIKGVRGRFEVVPTNKDFTVIIDFAHTPDGLEKVLNTIDKFAKGRIIIVFGAGGDRDKSRRSGMGEIAAKYCDLCIITSDNSRSEDPEKIIEDIIVGVKRANGKYVAIVDREEAIRYAIENGRSDDVILLAGKGHETYQIIGDKVLPFDERKIVLDILKEKNDDN